MPELGFAIKKDARWLVNRYFPSKIGGKPAWLDLNSLPTRDRLVCIKCKKPKVFLLQLYVPFEDEHNFHRMIYVFICRTATCYEANDARVVTVFRAQLPRKNKFFPETPPDESGAPLPEILIGNGNVNTNTDFTYTEWEIINDIVSDEDDENDDNIDEDEKEAEQMREYENLVATGQTGSLGHLTQNELDKYVASGKLREDEYFEIFQRECKINPDQILRYDLNGAPLWITSLSNELEIQLNNIPKCSYCGSARQFEFQIMPQLLYYLKDYNVDWGVIAIYTCSKSCLLPNTESYADEIALKQDIANKTQY